MKKQIFIAHSLKLTEQAIAYEKQIGKKCYIPGRDTPQTYGEEILERNKQGLLDCEEVHVIWDGVSLGTIFDMGMAYSVGNALYPGLDIPGNSLPHRSSGRRLCYRADYRLCRFSSRLEKT